MTDNASAAAVKPQPADYVQIWADSFSQVLAQITGAAMACLVHAETPAGLPPSGGDEVWAMVTCAGGLRGEMSLRLPPEAALGLAQRFMSEAVAPEAALTPDHREAVIELLRQVAGVAASRAQPRWGELQLRIEAAVGAASWPAAETFWLQAGAEGAANLLVEFGLSAALVAELRAEKIEAGPAAPDSAASAASGSGGPGAGALDMLMEVRLALTMRFGARRLRLREVLELSPGAVVELDRRVEEPVELLLDGRLVACGEVVVIDGSYGLRVTDVSPLARPGVPPEGVGGA
jgi:flagellar motor switch protein FliN